MRTCFFSLLPSLPLYVYWRFGTSGRGLLLTFLVLVCVFATLFFASFFPLAALLFDSFLILLCSPFCLFFLFVCTASFRLRRSFFQSVCILGYCLFPLDVAAFLNLFVPRSFPLLKLFFSFLALPWSTGGEEKENEREEEVERRRKAFSFCLALCSSVDRIHREQERKRKDKFETLVSRANLFSLSLVQPSVFCLFLSRPWLLSVSTLLSS